MPLPAFVQKNLESKGVNISKMKPGVHIPKTVPGITINHDHPEMVKAIRAGISMAKKAPNAMFLKKREPGAKPELPSFMKKK